MKPALVALAAAIVAAGCGRPDPIPSPVPAEARGPKGAELYARYCGFCHGDAGQGYLADNANALANARFLEAASDTFLREAIVHGRPGTPMSAWGAERDGPLADADVTALIAFIRTWQRRPPITLDESPSAGVAARGAPIYKVMCASCHGDEGQGVSAVSLNNPRFHATASDGFIRHAIVHGRLGTPMMAYRDRLDSRQVEDLVAYLRAWRRPVDSAPPTPYEPDLDAAVLNPTGENPDFAPREDRFVPVDAVHAALKAGKRLVLLDARAADDFQQGHIEGAVGIPFYGLESYLDRLPRDTWIIAYCGCPHAVSGQAVDALKAAGFARAAILDEGYYVWKERGYPVSE